MANTRHIVSPFEEETLDKIFTDNFYQVLKNKEKIQRELKFKDDDFYFYVLVSDLLCRNHFKSLFDSNEKINQQKEAFANAFNQLSVAAQSVFCFQLAQEKVTTAACKLHQQMLAGKDVLPDQSFIGQYQRYSKAREDKVNAIKNDKNLDQIQDKHVEQIADRDRGYANFFIKEQLQVQRNDYRENGSFLKDEACRNFLTGLKLQIISREWKVMRHFGIGGVVVKGLNGDKAVPDSVATLYKYLDKTLMKNRLEWEKVKLELEKFKQVAERKNASWNFFWKRDPSTIDFNKSLIEKVGTFLTAMDDVTNHMQIKIINA